MKHFKTYIPITATPYRQGDDYVEVTPCEALKPYIRCFWGSKDVYTRKLPLVPGTGLVVPDTCMDIMFTVNYTKDRFVSAFCGIDDRASDTVSGDEVNDCLSVFGIRFYAWSTVLFSEESMQGCRNFAGDARMYFAWLVRALEQRLWETVAIEERVRLAEAELLKRIDLRSENGTFMDAVAQIISGRGALRMHELAGEMHVSNRQLQRVFQENMGISPKRFASLVRYQNLWRDILTVPNRPIMDEVHRLQYTDQAHLLHEFKHYHGMTIQQACVLAREHVAF